MIAALVLALALGSASAAVMSSALAVSASPGLLVGVRSEPATVAQTTPQADATTVAARLAALHVRYEKLYAAVAEPRVMVPTVREELMVRIGSAVQTMEALASDPNEAVLADLERRVQLDELAVPQLLSGSGAPADAAAGAHAGVTKAGSLPVPFAYWVPAGYDARRPAALVVLLHGASQPESDLIARRFLRELADATVTVVLAPGGDDRDPDAMFAALDAAQAALATTIAVDPRRRYIGGFSNGVISAYHAVARDVRGYAGFLGIAGFLRGEDARAVGRRLHGQGAYLVIGANDEVIGAAAIRANVRTLRGRGVYARYYEVAGAPHALRPLEGAIARAWRDMLAGVTSLENDGLGTVTESF
jgi:predicted esterase